MKTYWKVLLSSFGALVPVIHRDQKFKSNSNDTAADRENLIWACKAPTFGTNHHTSSYLVLTTTKHSLRALAALKTPTLTSVDFSPSLYDIIKIIYKRRAVNTIRVLALSQWAVNTVQTPPILVFDSSLGQCTTLNLLSRGQVSVTSRAVVRCSQFNGDYSFLK